MVNLHSLAAVLPRAVMPSLSAFGAWLGAAAVGIGLVVGGASIPSDGSHKNWADPMITIGFGVIVVVTVIFGLAHLRLPSLVRRARIRMYLHPYAPDQFFTDARLAVPSSLTVTARTVDLKPYGWSEADPFIQITYSVFNGSMYHVTFGDTLKGDMYVGDAVLLDQPTLYQGGGGWSPGAEAQVKVNQRLRLALWEELSSSVPTDNGAPLLRSWDRRILLPALRGSVTVPVTASYPESPVSRMSLSGGGDAPFSVRRQ